MHIALTIRYTIRIVNAMKSYAEIIAHWPSLVALAEDLGVNYVTAQQMKVRGSISAAHWKRLVAGAQKRGIEGVTLDVLAQLATETPVRQRRIQKKVEAETAAA